MVKTTESFLKDVKEVMRDDYENFDFSNADYRGATKPIKYLCKKHNKLVEKKTAREILNNSYGCGTCVTEKRKKTKIEKSNKKFFEEGPKIHNNEYKYDKVVFIDMTTHVLITCPIHGDFLQAPCKHINEKQGCNKCGEERSADKQKMGKDEFIRRSIEKHGNEHYGYHLVNYINCDTNVEIFCNICNKSFQQTPSTHLSGSGCTYCGIIKRATLKKQTAEVKFREQAKNDEQVDSSKFIYTKNTEKSILTCMKCKEDYLITPNGYARYKNYPSNGCPNCVNKTEQKFYEILKPLFPNLKWRYVVDWCRNTIMKNGKYNNFPFDYCLEELKIIIELDGIDHFEPTKRGDISIEEQINKYKQTRKRDLYKQNCANDNGYSVIRIYQPDVYFDSFDWLEKVLEAIEKVKIEGFIPSQYISKNDEYKDFENFDASNVVEVKTNTETYCKVCDITINYNYRQHENTQKHKNKLLNIEPDNSKKTFCTTCNKHVTDKRRHYNTENHKSKITTKEWEKQIQELDIDKSKKKVTQYDLNNNKLKTFDSINDAYRYLKKTYGGSIGRCCNDNDNGKSKSCLGYIWKWNN